MQGTGTVHSTFRLFDDISTTKIVVRSIRFIWASVGRTIIGFWCQQQDLFQLSPSFVESTRK